MEDEAQPPYLIKETAITFSTESACVLDARKHFASLRFPFMILLSIINEPLSRHPVYKTVKMREASFHNWPPSIPFKGREMAEAGFFYTGMHDQVTCYSCGKTLKQWKVPFSQSSHHRRALPFVIHPVIGFVG